MLSWYFPNTFLLAPLQHFITLDWQVMYLYLIMEKQLSQDHFLDRDDAAIKLVGSHPTYTAENSGVFYKCFIFS